MVTDWTEKLNENGSAEQNGWSGEAGALELSGDNKSGSGMDGLSGSRNRLKQQCFTSMETQQTQIKQVEGGILLTESCTDGEAIVAAETDEFYGCGMVTVDAMAKTC